MGAARVGRLAEAVAGVVAIREPNAAADPGACAVGECHTRRHALCGAYRARSRTTCPQAYRGVGSDKTRL